ncbi:YesL family protein [Bacillus nitroreducens]
MGESRGIFRFMEFLNWLVQLAYVQLLWGLFTLLGVGIVGLFPATNAMYSIIRKWLSGNTDVPVFSFMWNTYKKEFIKSNLYFYSFVLIGMIFYFYFKLFQSQESLLHAILTIVLFIVLIFYCIGFMIAIPIYAHFDLKLRSFYKMTLYTIFSFPFHMITIIVIHVLFYLLISYIPGLAPFISFSILAFAVTVIMRLVFTKMDEKQIVVEQGN